MLALLLLGAWKLARLRAGEPKVSDGGFCVTGIGFQSVAGCSEAEHPVEDAYLLLVAVAVPECLNLHLVGFTQRMLKTLDRFPVARG